MTPKGSKIKTIAIMAAIVLTVLLGQWIDQAYPGEFSPPPDPCPDGSCDKRPYPVEVWSNGDYAVVLREWFQTDRELKPLISFSAPLSCVQDE